MIFYFSGTGNSRYVAEYVANRLNDSILDIAALKSEGTYPSLKAGCRNKKSIGFVFPIYSWGVPPIVCEFIRAISDEDVKNIIAGNLRVWMIATCGDETGNAHIMFRKLLQHRGLKLDGAWSVILPNTYVLLPGFDVDDENQRKRKISEAPSRLDYISDKIEDGEWEYDLTIGKMALFKTAVVYPLFKRWGIFPKKWKSKNDCINCEICESECPVRNISMVNGRPQWGTNCLSCLACYHSCPRHSVNYGRITERKGQYRPSDHPKI